jgi:hypothetical protein
VWCRWWRGVCVLGNDEIALNRCMQPPRPWRQDTLAFLVDESGTEGRQQRGAEGPMRGHVCSRVGGCEGDGLSGIVGARSVFIKRTRFRFQAGADERECALCRFGTQTRGPRKVLLAWPTP